MFIRHLFHFHDFSCPFSTLPSNFSVARVLNSTSRCTSGHSPFDELATEEYISVNNYKPLSLLLKLFKISLMNEDSSTCSSTSSSDSIQTPTLNLEISTILNIYQSLAQPTGIDQVCYTMIDDDTTIAYDGHELKYLRTVEKGPLKP